jgi:polysaccharide biosynthesis protein PslG
MSSPRSGRARPRRGPLEQLPQWIAVSAVLVLLAGVLSAVAMRTHPSDLRPQVGVQFHGMWSAYSDDERARFLDQLAEAGGTWVRLDVSWAMLQPEGPDEFDTGWGVPFVDRVIDMITERGLQPLVMLWLTPAWANDDAGERVLPDDPDDYAAAARWAAARWADQVPAWQVWNEPNDEDFLVGADPVGYTDLLRAAYPALKTGNPQATVVFGGTSLNDVDWIEQAYDAGAQGSFDAMATHPYMSEADLPPDTSGDGTKGFFRHLTAVHDLMVEQGDGDLPIWATEFGWRARENTGDERPWQRGVTEEEQAEYLLLSIELVQQEMPWVTHMFWYRDRDQHDGSANTDGYGLLDADLRPKPAFRALESYLTGRWAPDEAKD